MGLAETNTAVFMTESLADWPLRTRITAPDLTLVSSAEYITYQHLHCMFKEIPVSILSNIIYVTDGAVPRCI